MGPQDSEKTILKLEDIHYYERTENTFQKAFVAIQCNCALCATNLEIQVSGTDIAGEVREEAFCPQCNIRMRSKSHTVQ